MLPMLPQPFFHVNPPGFPIGCSHHEGSDAARNQRHQQRSGVVIGQGIYLRTPKGYTYRPLL